MTDHLEVPHPAVHFRFEISEGMSGRTSRAVRSPNRDNWADRSFKMAEVTYSPYSPRLRRPLTAPARIDVDDVASIVSRLSRPNTSSARKAVLWSQPRREYEFNYEMSSSLKNPTMYWTQFPQLAKHYPGTWRVAKPDEMDNIVSRLTKTTVASQARKQDCVSRRRLIERVKEADVMADIAYRQRMKEESRKQPADHLVSSRSNSTGESDDLSSTESVGESAIPEKD